MAPEYGATMGFFPVDEMTVAYFEGTGRTKEEVERFEAYYKAQGLFGMPAPGDIDYTKIVKLDLGTVSPSLAGPKRPQDRIDLGHLATKFSELYSKPNDANGFNQPADKLKLRYPLAGRPGQRRRGGRTARRRAARRGRDGGQPLDQGRAHT
jgi:aconitate hydratase